MLIANLTPDIDSELLAWIEVAEEQIRKDNLIQMETGRYYGVSITPPDPQAESDRINRAYRINLAACERAEVLCCQKMLSEMEEK
jgi:hypothetical protein